MGTSRLDVVDATLAQLEVGGATLAQALLDLDARAARILPDQTSSPGQAAVTGQTATCASRARDRLDWLWDRYTALSDVLARARNLRGVGSRLAPRRTDELEALLHRASVLSRPPPPHSVEGGADARGSAGAAGASAGGADPGAGVGGGAGTRGGGVAPAEAGNAMYPEELLTGTAETVAAVRADLDALEAARFGNLAALTAAEQEITDLAATADRIGAGIVPELASARALLGNVARAVATDPMSVSASDLSAVADAARRAADATAALVRVHDSLADDLRAAADLLDEIVTVATEGERAARTVVDRVTGTETGLLRLDEGWFDDPRRGLRPWLDRLTDYRAAGDWQRAGRGLAAWSKIATDTLAAARRVAETNVAPLTRRDELRGLLGALRAKAVGNGLAEVADLESVFLQAREALYTSPTDLDAAEDLVRSYSAHLVEWTDRKERTP